MTSPAQLKRSAIEAEREAEGASRTELAGVEIGLNAAIVAVADNEPVVLIIRGSPTWRAPPMAFRSDLSRR